LTDGRKAGMGTARRLIVSALTLLRPAASGIRRPPLEVCIAIVCENEPAGRPSGLKFPMRTPLSVYAPLGRSLYLVFGRRKPLGTT
jgi:hypothetical protein